MAQIIKAQFMHQHKDKAVYEREILIDTPSLTQYDDDTRQCVFCFEMPLILNFEPKWMFRWFNSSRNSRITRRSLRFVNSDGIILCELPKRPFKANIRFPESCDTDIPTIHILCAVEKDEIKELGKIFFPKYFAD